MKNKAKYCDTCQELLTDSDGNNLKDYLHLVKGVAETEICSDCCEIGVHKPFLQIGFKQSDFKTAVERQRLNR